jgi:hypothetical protein
MRWRSRYVPGTHDSDSHPLLRALAPLGAPASGAATWVVGRSVAQAAVAVVVYVVGYALWRFVDVWLVPMLSADADYRTAWKRRAAAAAAVADPAQLPRDLTDRSASSTTLRQGDEADRRSWRSIRSTVRSVVDRLRRRGVSQQSQPRAGSQ